MFNSKQQCDGRSAMEMSKQSWGGSMRSTDLFSDTETQSVSELGRSMRTDDPTPRRVLGEIERSWLLDPDGKKKKKNHHPMIQLSFVSCRKRWFWWAVSIFCACVLVVGVAVVSWRFAPKKHHFVQVPDEYTVALGKALTFFDIQKSGDLQASGEKGKNISWRGSSALLDGRVIHNGSAPAANLAGGFYDAGDNVKFGFTSAFAMTLLSWSVIEYKTTFQALGELDHAQELIKWGTDYLLKTFNASQLDRIYCQVGMGGGALPNDHYCWERPEDIDHFHDTRRSAIAVTSGSDLACEMAAALASAAIVFRDQPSYVMALRTGAEALYKFAKRRPSLFVDDKAFPVSERPFYNSSGFHDEMIWGATWLYLATGNVTYLRDATVSARDNSNRGGGNAFGAFDWDSKLMGAQLLLSRLRMLQGPGYPYEQVLQQYNYETNLVMCAYFPEFPTFTRTPGGLILFNPNATQHLPAAVTAAFVATLYADYLDAADVPVIQCGPNWLSPDALRNFSRSQVDYVLGKNPQHLSYVVGCSTKFPQRPHHRAASIPSTTHDRFSCTQGWHFRDRDAPNPHLLEGAMVGGPDHLDSFNDTRANSDQNEPTLSGNAGLVGALVALSSRGGAEEEGGVDAHSIFSAIPASGMLMPPPAEPWSP